MLPVNEAQAMLPDGDGPAQSAGTARACGSSIAGRPIAVVSMPGVPYEMKGLVEEEVLPRVLSKWALPTRYHRTAHARHRGKLLE